jgi:glutamate-1-semialdehyde 2,1-aminomutase
MKADTEKFARFFARLLEEGIYIAPSQYEAMFISAAHSGEELEKTFTAIEKILSEIF